LASRGAAFFINGGGVAAARRTLGRYYRPLALLHGKQRARGTTEGGGT
jgi:hypothetical protein